jgi:hypothetical protein
MYHCSLCFLGGFLPLFSLWQILNICHGFNSAVKPVNSNLAKWGHPVKERHLSGPKMLFSVQIAPWNEDTSDTFGSSQGCPYFTGFTVRTYITLLASKEFIIWAFDGWLFEEMHNVHPQSSWRYFNDNENTKKKIMD